MWNKTVLTVLLQWDYGQPSRGISLEKGYFFSTLQQLVERVEPLWYDEFLSDTDSLQELVIRRARELRPDLIIFIPYSEQFTCATLDSLKRDYRTFAWFSDDQWRFENYTSRYAPHYTYVSTTEPWCVDKYRNIGIEPILTQWAARPFSEAIGPLGEDENYEYDVSFVGSCNKYRKWFIRELLRQGIIVECFGAGWPNGRVSNQQMEQIFRKSRINLNISNSVSHDIRFIFNHPLNLLHYLRSPKRVESTKARNFEIPLAGGFQLTNYVPCLERYLTIGEEVALYSTPEECAGQIRYYLSESSERCRIASRGHERVMNEHTYRHRLEHILNVIWGAPNDSSPGKSPHARNRS